jgi:putative ABC transport system permease protein
VGGGDRADDGQPKATAAARLNGVSAAAGGLDLTDNQAVVPARATGVLQPPTSFTVDGLDIGHAQLGPLSAARISSGAGFTAADQDQDVAVVDADYAAAHGLKVGSTVTAAKVRFTVIGIATQPEGSSPPDV